MGSFVYVEKLTNNISIEICMHPHDNLPFFPLYCSLSLPSLSIRLQSKGVNPRGGLKLLQIQENHQQVCNANSLNQINGMDCSCDHNSPDALLCAIQRFCIFLFVDLIFFFFFSRFCHSLKLVINLLLCKRFA